MSEFINLVKLRIFPRQISHKTKILPGIKSNDELQRLVIFAGHVENRFSFQMSEFVNLVKLQIFPRQISHKTKILPGIKGNQRLRGNMSAELS